MHRFRHFAARLMALACACALLFAAGFYVISGTLAGDTTQRLARQEVEDGVREGLCLLDARARGEMTADELTRAVNPPLNPAGFFYALLDGEGRTLAATEQAARVLRTLTEKELLALPAGAPAALTVEEMDGLLLMGQRGATGIALAGRTVESDNHAMVGFRTLLARYVLPLAALLAAVILLLWRRVLRPAELLISAMQRLSEGEAVEVREKLPAELRPLGRAFNRMAYRLSTSISDLTYARDVVTLILQGLDEGVIALDNAGDALYENRAALQLLGGRESTAYAQVLEALREALEGEREPLRLTRGERTLVCAFRPIPRGEGGSRGALAVLRDVTEHERLERTRREYVANISHELRTPLASMRGLTEGLRDGLVDSEEERQHCYDLLVSEVRRLSRLVSDLLELSSLQSGAASFTPETFDARETLFELCDRTQPLAREKRITLRLEAEEGELTVRSNEDRLQQVLTILLDNAIKFTPEGGEVTLGAARAARGVRFFVRDNGIGMDEYTLRHAFDRFHQADPSHSAKGSGLGLAIAREVIQRLNGRIAVKSAPGKGSEFSFVQPYDEP